ncbi:MAG: hypothetical protein ACE5PM_03315 [Candidatus Hydrothermarchaeales archaeon]
MVEASPYMLKRLIELMDSCTSSLSEYADIREGRGIGGKKLNKNAIRQLPEKKLLEYEKILDKILRKFEEVIMKYPEDDEVKECFGKFLTFCEERRGYKLEREKEELKHCIRRMKHHVDWRIVKGASGRVLGKKDFRSLRGSREKRGKY